MKDNRDEPIVFLHNLKQTGVLKEVTCFGPKFDDRSPKVTRLIQAKCQHL